MSIAPDSTKHLLDNQVTSSARFIVQCQGWSTGIGFSELAGFSSSVASQEYSFNGKKGNFLTRQFGRPSAPTVALKGALQKSAFVQMFTWHRLARDNNPLARIPAMFTIQDGGGRTMMAAVLEEAWCSKLELDAAQAGSSNVVMMKITIECEWVRLI